MPPVSKKHSIPQPRTISPEDRSRLGHYFQSVREMKARLQRQIEWEERPKPVVDYPQPTDIAAANRIMARG